MKNILRVAALGSVAAFALAACGSAPSSSSTSAAASSFKACMVSDAGGFDDKSFNESGYDGLMKAKTDLGIAVKTAESKAATDYEPNVDAMVSDKCDLIVGVGFNLKDTIQKAATSNPDVKFALIDSSFSDANGKTLTFANAKPILFDTAQAAYLAGYVAAGVSTTGVVGTYGGMQIPSVTIFMDGYADGVARYNADNGKSVKLVGWDKTSQKGTFTGDFDDQSKGQSVGLGLMDQGADVIMPVAGPVGQGTVAAIKSSGSSTLIVGVDSDWALSSPGSANITLTSVMKEIGQATYDTVKETEQGRFSADPYVGTLKNQGVGLAPYHDLASKVPSSLSDKVDQLKQGIIDGTITVGSVAAPK